MKTTLAQQEARFDKDAHLIWKNRKATDSSGRFPAGSRVHPIRESIDYALELLLSNQPDTIDRARNIISQVLSFQNRDARESTYGLWPQYVEEPLYKASDPNRFWADVVGFRLCKIYWRHRYQLPAELVESIKSSISHAALSILSRGQSLAEERSSLISGIVVLMGAELLGEASLTKHGLKRVREIVERTQRSGEFGEYNSPDLTLLALEECNFLMDAVRDQTARQYAEQLRYIAWRTILEHYHPATEQWGGPHGWALKDTLEPGTILSLIDRDTGCPPEMRTRFDELSDEEIVVHCLYAQPVNENGNAAATTWLTKDLCLGSVDEELLWERRRPLIGYWNNRDGGVASLRARFLHDGNDFASGLIRSVQSRGRILSSFSLDRQSGDTHPYRDRPTNGVFRGSDFRVRYQLTAPDASFEDLGNGLYRLASGRQAAIIHAFPGYFDRSEVRWTVGRDGDTVFVDAVCYTGETRNLRMKRVRTVLLAAALEIIDIDQEPSLSPVIFRVPNQRFLLRWPGLELPFSSRPRGRS